MILVLTSNKNFQLKLKLALSAPVLALAPCFLFYASTAAADDSWQNLKHVTHESYYTVVDRKFSCITGHIVKTNDHELTLKLPTERTPGRAIRSPHQFHKLGCETEGIGVSRIAKTIPALLFSHN